MNKIYITLLTFLFTYSVIGQTPAKDIIPSDSTTVKGVNNTLNVHVADLQKMLVAAKEKLEQANKTPEERKHQLDEMLATIRKALTEVSEGGDIYGLLQSAITTSESKAKEYKGKMSDPNKSAKIQEQYQLLMEKFKNESEALYRSKISMNTRRADLVIALKVAEENKELYVDLLLADQLAEANQAVIYLVQAMAKVTDSINDMASEMGVKDSKFTRILP